jgi:hypothetical protein
MAGLNAHRIKEPCVTDPDRAAGKDPGWPQ